MYAMTFSPGSLGLLLGLQSDLLCDFDPNELLLHLLLCLLFLDNLLLLGFLNETGGSGPLPLLVNLRLVVGLLELEDLQ